MEIEVHINRKKMTATLIFRTKNEYTEIKVPIKEYHMFPRKEP